MGRPAKSDPDPLKPVRNSSVPIRDASPEGSFEADFTDLAARFAALGGGSLSPELSFDLALEIVLNEVVEQACLATGATGAAIVLERDGEMVCRASTGSTAPELGLRLDTASGLSGECIRTHQTQRCEDALADERVNAEASRQLGVRSVMIMPLLRGEEMAGIFEVFSSAPRAFGERDELTLKALAGRILSNLERASRPESATAALPAPLPVQWESLPAADTPQKEIPVTPVDESQRGVEQNLERKFDWITFALGAAVLACAVLLGVLMVVHLTMPTREKTTSRPHASARLSGGDAAPAGVSAPVDASASAKQETANPAARPARPKWNDKGVPPGGLRVFENGKEVFRLPPQSPAATAPDEMQSGSSGGADKVVQLSPAMAASSLLRRVEPEYPSVALQQKIQGSVVMDLHIGADGAVQDVQVVSGPPQLAAAATDAVRQWRYSPRILNGHPAKMQTRLKLDFKLPQ